ncbi:DUF7266 family protein [Halorientalis litorea]|uniref:DUF7266 family protein n=1 Tax=Halorientalis litorea TaxID=2931977 RepID=UPI001FF14C51|nr:hypothetical protein [Halorientalis litorea]
MTDRFESDRRGQSITLSYTLGIGIATILVTGLLIAGAGFVSDQREQAAEVELRVIGQQLASDVEATDRLVQSGDRNTAVSISRSFPQSVAGSGYTVAIVEQADPYVRLRSQQQDVTVRVEFSNRTTVDGTEITGGQVMVNYTAGGHLRLEGGERR